VCTWQAEAAQQVAIGGWEVDVGVTSVALEPFGRFLKHLRRKAMHVQRKLQARKTCA
jgi:hypothetical protein